MHYMLLIHADPSGFEKMPPAEAEKAMSAYTDYTKALKAAKVHVSSDRLKPAATASTVRHVNGKLKVQDGPFIESKEQLGGYYLIDVPDLDEALKWAGKCPGAHHGAVEVRAIWS